MDLHQLIFVSVATPGRLGPDQLDALVTHCRANNLELGVTGMLLHHDGGLLQLLEGDRDVLERLYDHIAADPRHQHPTQLTLEPINRRRFDAQPMAYAEPTASDLQGQAEFNDPRHRGNPLAGLAPDRALQILSTLATPECPSKAA